MPTGRLDPIELTGLAFAPRSAVGSRDDVHLAEVRFLDVVLEKSRSHDPSHAAGRTNPNLLKFRTTALATLVRGCRSWVFEAAVSSLQRFARWPSADWRAAAFCLQQKSAQNPVSQVMSPPEGDDNEAVIPAN